MNPTNRKSPTPKPTTSRARRNGNVARLPKALRDKINVMLEDGYTYPAIKAALGPDGCHLSPSSLSRWKNGGHQDWLAEQAFIRSTHARQETPAELVRDFDPTQVGQAALHLGTLHIFDAFRDLTPGSLNQKLGGDCAAFARLLNALSRATRESIQVQKYREACARAKAALLPMMDPKRKLTESERRAIVLQVDDILGLDANEDEPPPPLTPHSTGLPETEPPTDSQAPPAPPASYGAAADKAA